MTETDGPGKNEIALVFKKLRAIAGNKSCFDCGASNPTWSSVTYGVFICIDCSAVHRGLGVHLTFVRSTNLDTNWTWLQVRAMQCGGNANAQQFFRQHGCTTTDAQQKYRSRAAQLYRDKLHHLCAQTQRMHGNKLFLDSACQLSPSGAEDVDFFAEHTSSTHSDGGLRHNMSSTSINAKMMLGGEDDEEDTNDHRNGNIPINQKPTDGREPSVDHILTETAPAKPKPASIGTRKPAGAKKMGAKKMGAQKVKANFEELEQKAETIEKEKEQSSRLGMEPEKTVEPEVNKLSERLMIQDMSDKRTKHVEKNFKHDPTKAEQAERLGMGYVRDTKAASHSVASSISVIQQEGIRSKQPTYPKAFQTADTFYDAKDDWEVVSSDPPSKRDDLFGMVESNGSSKKKTTTDFGDSWDNVVDARDDKPKSSFGGYGVKSPVAPTPAAASNYADSDEASKKFGGAKAISSDMFFGNNTTDFETKTTLSKFDGATSISSSDFYGGGPGVGGGGQGGGGAYGYGSGYREQMPDMQDVKDSARAAASKVAGKFSSAMGSVQNYVQDNYNY